MKSKQCIVVWDDGGGLCVPMGWDPECEGAIGGWSGNVAVFPDRAAARKAINISACYAKLMASQGKPENTDFTSGRKNLQIRLLEARNK